MRVSMSRLWFVFALSSTSPAFADAVAGSAGARVSIKADVRAEASARATAGDAAYAAGAYDAAISAYGEGFAQTRDSAFLYAMARCHKALGHASEARAMFELYLSAKGQLRYKAQAETELGAKRLSGRAFGAVKSTTKVVAGVGAGVFDAAQVSVSATIDAGARAEAKVGDTAYAAGKFEDAARSYARAYAKSQHSVALYAQAQASARAGHAAEARGTLAGYLASGSTQYAKEARTLLLAVGGRADLAVKVSIQAKVSANIRSEAGVGDRAMATGKFLDAAKAYANAYDKKADAALLYARGMAELYAGQTRAARTSLEAYLKTRQHAELRISAQAALHAAGGAS